MRFALAPVLVALLAAVARPSDYRFPIEPPRPDAVAAALTKVKARRAALDRLAGPHPAFDLTYLPRPATDMQALIGLRPALLFAHPDLAPTADWLGSLGGQGLRMFGGNPAGPGLAGLDQLLLCGTVTVTPNPNPTDDKPALFVIGATGFVARAAKPFDWPAAVRAWLPRVAPRTHNGEAYLAVRIDLTGILPGFTEPFDMALYAAPDGRTLVVDSETCVKELIDRRRAGRAVTPPPGWDGIDRAAVALAIDNRNKQWVTFLPYHPGPVTAADGVRLFRAADQFAVGIDAGPVSRFRLTAFCRDPFQAKHARHGMREALSRLSDRFAPASDETPSPEWAELVKRTDALLKDGKATPTPLGFEYVGDAPGDLFGAIARLAEPASPPPHLPPPTPTRPPLPGDVSVTIPMTRSPIPGDTGVPGYILPASAPPAPPGR